MITRKVLTEMGFIPHPKYKPLMVAHCERGVIIRYGYWFLVCNELHHGLALENSVLYNITTTAMVDTQRKKLPNVLRTVHYMVQQLGGAKTGHMLYDREQSHAYRKWTLFNDKLQKGYDQQRETQPVQPQL